MNQNIKHATKAENPVSSQKLGILKAPTEKLNLELTPTPSEEWRLTQEPAIWLEAENHKNQAILLTHRLQNR